MSIRLNLNVVADTGPRWKQSTDMASVLRCIALFACTFWVAGCGSDSNNSRSSNANSGRRVDASEVVDETTSPLASNDSWQAMRSAMLREDWQLARRHAAGALLADPNDPDLLTDAAKVAAMCGSKREAARLMVDAARAANYQPASRVDFAVQALVDVGELYAAIDLLEQTLEIHPENHRHRRTLVGFLGEVQRTEMIGPHIESLLRSRSFDVHCLLATTEQSSRRFSVKTAEAMLERNPEDHRVRLGEARNLSDIRDTTAAEQVLKEILTHHPRFAPAHALLGQILVAGEKLDRLDSWYEAAPEETRRYADYWLTLGDWASEHDEPESAARAYWEATRRDPNETAAWTRLARTLRQLQDDQPSERLVSDEQLADIDRRIAELLELRKQFHSFGASNQTSQRHAANVAESLAALGRNWEAEAWSAIATTLNQDSADDLSELRERIIENLRRDASWLSSRQNPALTINLSRLPEPRITSRSPRSKVTQRVVPSIATSKHLRMSDETGRWQLSVPGGVASREEATAGPLIRSTGVGGGTIDFDLDGRGDVLAVGAGGTMLKSDSNPNQLLRNLGDRFVLVTGVAGVGDTGFGQGLGVGDFNEDGFPDLFYANLGRNRLLRNNGDGSFTDCSDLLENSSAQEWTTCGVFADVDGDAIADLITANYCQAVEKLDQPCPNSEGVDGPCHPLKFPAASDRFFAGTVHGRLREVTDRWAPKVSPGRGLGILAGSLSNREMAFLIVNDMSVNEFYSWDGQGQGRLVESAAVRGVAVDARTLTQASMGIASSDLDGDGDLDIYVTGFGHEYNIVYEQVAPGLWSDETGKLGLIEPTLPVVGFGTEAIDLDDDGLDELLVTNGHIGKFDGDSLPFEQPFQAFRRGGSGKFELIDDDHWGGYFADLHVGRAMWTLDANGDGRSDVIVTHAYEPARLLVNRSENLHRRIAFKLVGVGSSRDAVGAVVEFEAGGRQRTLWQVAGGYMCSNESILRAGLGTADQAENVTVTWRDGTVDRIGTLDADSEYVIVQGSQDAFRTASFSGES